jgi:anti-sigma regulatory factor (Ser/Thr protein kinase)
MAVVVEPGEHVVQFYERDDELIETVGAYLVEAIAGGEVAIVVADEAHRAAFEAALTAAAIDVEEARASGNLIALDAAETLARFMAGGLPDAAAFDAVIGDLVRRAGETGRPVRAYGEMVALLWDEGSVNAAVEVEALWNELGLRTPFSLFCAYPTHAGGDDTRAFDDVCSLHSGTVETRTFAGSVQAPGAARRFVVETLARRGHGNVVDHAAAVVTELATNSVLHAQSEFVVAISDFNGVVRISVRDGSAAPPLPCDAESMAVSGRGLALVGAVAARWGVEELDDGKAVWAELRRSTGVSP